jgi:hypothetical protein
LSRKFESRNLYKNPFLWKARNILFRGYAVTKKVLSRGFLTRKLKSAVVLLSAILVVSLCATSTDFFVNAASSSASVPPVAEWEEFYGSGDEVFQIIQTSDDGYAFIGAGWSHQFSSEPTRLFKVDSSGNMQWNKTIRGSALVQTADGGYVIAGGAAAGITLIKTDSKGNIKWDQIYNSESTTVKSMVQTTDGGYAMACTRATLIKIDSFAKLQWQKTYGSPQNINFFDCVIQTSDGGYALAGSTSFDGKTNSPNLYFWLVKTDSNGNLKWSQSYGTGPDALNTNSTINPYVDESLNRFVAGDNEAKSVVQTADGGYVLAGMSYPQNYGVTLLVKTDSLGNIEWNQTYGGPGEPIFTTGYSADSLIKTSDGGLAFAGSKPRYVSGGYSVVWLVKTNMHGNMEWNQTFDESWEAAFSGANSLIETRDGSLLLAGYRTWGSPWLGQYYLIKTEQFLPPPTPSPTIVPTSSPSSTPFDVALSTLIVIIVAVVIVILTAVFLAYKIKRKKAENSPRDMSPPQH